MTRFAELALFVVLALIVHLGFWFGIGRAGSESAGSGGDATVSLMAATGEIADMVEAWTKPVEAVTSSPSVPSPPAPDTAPQTTSAAVVSPDTPESPSAPIPPSVDAPATVTLPSPIPDLPEIEQPIMEMAALPPEHAMDTPIELTPEAQGKLAPASRPLAAPDAPASLPEIDQSTARPPVLDAAPGTSLRPVPRPTARPSEATDTAQQDPRPSSQTSSPSQQSTGSLPQTAAGQRSGENAGNANQQRAATLSPATRQNLLAQWGASIRNSVERQKRYPRGARASGTAVVRLTVSRSGQLRGVSLARSSGVSELDQAAMSAVKRARFASAPRQLDVPHYSFNLPVAFSR